MTEITETAVETTIVDPARTAAVRAVADFIANEVTAGASVAHRAFLRDMKNPGSVPEEKLRHVLNRAINDYALLNDTAPAA